MTDLRDEATGTPGWVKVFGTITVLVIVGFVVLLLARGPHRPGRHGFGPSMMSPGTQPTSPPTDQSPW